MQLKDLAKVSEVTSIIKKTFDNFSNIPNGNLAKNKVIVDALTKSTKGYSDEVIVAAINQGLFTEAQARQILQTTTLSSEQIEATLSTSSLAASQATTTTTTLGLGTAFKGLGIKIKQATASMWTFLTTNPLGWATLAASTIAALAFGVKKYNDYIEEAKESARERTSELFDEFKQMNDTLSDHKKTVSELADRYTELSKGVNISNNKNVSLSTSDNNYFIYNFYLYFFNLNRRSVCYYSDHIRTKIYIIK